jgi:hypothetical protein
MSWKKTTFFFVTSIKAFHNWFRSNATLTWFKIFYLWTTKISIIISLFFLKCIIIYRFNESEWLIAIWRRIIMFIKLSIKCTLKKMFKISIHRERTSFADVKMFALHYFYYFMKMSNSRNSFDECYYRDS